MFVYFRFQSILRPLKSKTKPTFSIFNLLTGVETTPPPLTGMYVTSIFLGHS